MHANVPEHPASTSCTMRDRTFAKFHFVSKIDVKWKDRDSMLTQSSALRLMSIPVEYIALIATGTTVRCHGGGCSHWDGCEGHDGHYQLGCHFIVDFLDAVVS